MPTSHQTRTAFIALALVTVAASCSQKQPGLATTSPPPPTSQPVVLAGSKWRLMEFRSSDDATGVVKPDDPAKYTMSLGSDGRVSMRLNCNQASGAWSSQAAAPDSGTFRMGPLAMTRAFCPPPSLDTQIARDADFVRSYLLRGGNLYLSLMADGGTYVWTPDAGTSK